MRNLSLFALLLVGVSTLLPANPAGSAPKKDGGWIPLGNGKDLAGWATYFKGRGKNGKVNDLVRVQDGVIHLYSGGKGDASRPPGYLATEKAYSYYQLRFDFKWGNERPSGSSSGLVYHAAAEDSLWPNGIEFQLGEGDTGGLRTTPGTRLTTTVAPGDKKSAGPWRYLAPERGGVVHTQGGKVPTRLRGGTRAEKDGWNRVEVIVKGGSAVHMVNGQVVARCTDLRRQTADGRWVPLTAGRLVFKAEGAEILLRDIAIRPVWGGPLEVPLTAVAPPPARPFVPAKLEVPEGFEVELAAGPPLVRHPMMICLDDRGRLFVAESAGLNLEARDLELVRPNSIRLLNDSKGKGKFDRAVTFADRLTFPMGVAWHAGALYVASPPYVWRFRDTKGNGKADEQTPLVGRFNDSGIGDSLHGTVFGPDGRLYWVHGIGGGGHEVRDRDGRLVVKSRAPGIFSCWPDGSDIRKHCAGGMNNPVELDFTDAGQAIGTVNLLWGNPRNDALVQWMWGGAYTNNEHLIRDVKRTGDLLGPTYSFGHAALSGLTRLRSDALGREYRDNFLVAEFNTQTIRRVKLTPSGSTWTGEGSVFVHSANRDVHFTDVLEDADGSILVVDTGGWFRNGCPESRISRPEVPGAIYRIRRKGRPAVADPRGLKIPWKKLTDAELGRLLDDDRFVVRERAIDELAGRIYHLYFYKRENDDPDIISMRAVLANSLASRRVRLNTVWACCRAHHNPPVRRSMGDRDPVVREAAAHAVFCNRDREAVGALLPLLRDSSRSVRREAATALGILKDSKAVPALLAALAQDNDRLLEHALIFALIEIDDPGAVLPGLADRSPRVRRAALIALDQMDHGNLTSARVVPLLGSGDLALERAALQVIGRHRGWAGEIVGALAKRLSDPRLSVEGLAGLRGVLVALSATPEVQRLVADTLARPETSPQVRLALLEVMAGSDIKDWPEDWCVQVQRALHSKQHDEVARAVAAAAAHPLPRFAKHLLNLAVSPYREPGLRTGAAGAFAATGEPLPKPVFRLLADQCGGRARPVERLAAARALAGARLDQGQRREVARLLARADPLVLPVLLDALEKGGDRETGLLLVASLEKSPGRGNLSAARLEHLLADYPPEVRRAAEPLRKQLRARAEGQLKRLEELRRLVLTGGDPSKGRQVFRNPRALCLTCHHVGNEGERIGPDLSHIGAARTRADLLEAIVLPSASFARGFEPYVATTRRGKIYKGILARQTADAVYLRTADRAEVMIARSEIEELAPGRESIMPEGLDRVLTMEELRDLLAFLASLK